MGLETYRRKRDFRKTPEPKGSRARKTESGNSYVIQKHAARRMHHDFRLELDGVLKSWAVPKGPPLEPRQQALAVHVEDHPVEYGTFEGVIPRGEYGGGTVMLYDRGHWEPEADPRRGLRDGKLTFRLDGERLCGRWSLVRLSGKSSEDGKNWLLIKRTDAPGDASIAPSGPARSVVSGRTMEEIATDADRVWSSRHGEITKPAARASARRKSAGTLDPSRVENAKRSALPSDLRPQLATLVTSAPEGESWIHEVKYDGYRLLAYKDGAKLKLRTRRGQDWTERFPTVSAAVAALNASSAILDGEVVVLGPDGISSFQALQNSLDRRVASDHVYFAFDLLYCDGYDVTAAPLIERKTLLARLLAMGRADGVLRYSEHIEGRGPDFFRAACELGLEGIVSKRRDARYEQRRTSSWLKTKCSRRQEFVVGGWTEPSGSRTHFGALLLGVYEGDELRYCGKVGTGFNGRSLAELASRLTKLATKDSPFANPPRGRDARGVHWTRPELVVEVTFTEWTSDGIVRHPSFQGVREDKKPRSVTREMAKPQSTAPSRSAARATSSRASGRSSKARVALGAEPSSLRASKTRSAAVATGSARGGGAVAGIELTHPERVLWPEDGITKEELARYYVSVAQWMLPELAGRPMTLLRCPRGYREECFYQRHVHEHAPPSVRGVPVREKGESRLYLAVDDLAGLLQLVQLDVLEFHVWGSRADRLEYPDRIVIDLDPDASVPWEKVVQTAKAVRARLTELDLVGFARTTGGKGLHVVIPIERRSTWDEVKRFAHDLVASVARGEPRLYVLTASKAKRKGKIYLDYLRNARTASAIASYSTRARAGAPVATPIRWEELSVRLDPARFNMRTIPQRLAKLPSDPWEDMARTRQALTKSVLERVRR